jgi:uncharacterized membrane protein
MPAGGFTAAENRTKEDRQMKSSLKGALIAVAVAGLFAANATLAADESKTIKSEEDEVKCSGINSCKGQGSCAGAGHECAGKNGCKGQGWVKVGSARACTDKGGKVDEN